MTHFRVYENNTPFVHVTLHMIIRKIITNDELQGIGGSHDIFKMHYSDTRF